jgi:hypothetical protein
MAAAAGMQMLVAAAATGQTPSSMLAGHGGGSMHAGSHHHLHNHLGLHPHHEHHQLQQLHQLSTNFSPSSSSSVISSTGSAAGHLQDNLGGRLPTGAASPYYQYYYRDFYGNSSKYPINSSSSSLKVDHQSSFVGSQSPAAMMSYDNTIYGSSATRSLYGGNGSASGGNFNSQSHHWMSASGPQSNSNAPADLSACSSSPISWSSFAMQQPSTPASVVVSGAPSNVSPVHPRPGSQGSDQQQQQAASAGNSYCSTPADPQQRSTPRQQQASVIASQQQLNQWSSRQSVSPSSLTDVDQQQQQQQMSASGSSNNFASLYTAIKKPLHDLLNMDYMVTFGSSNSSRVALLSFILLQTLFFLHPSLSVAEEKVISLRYSRLQIAILITIVRAVAEAAAAVMEQAVEAARLK